MDRAPNDPLPLDPEYLHGAMLATVLKAMGMSRVQARTAAFDLRTMREALGSLGYERAALETIDGFTFGFESQWVAEDNNQDAAVPVDGRH